MKRHRTAWSTVAAGLALIALAGAGGAAGREAEPATLRAPEVETIETGLRVAILRDTRLPIVQVQLLIPAGVATEGAGQSGIANLTAQTLRAGTTSRTAASLGADLDRLGAIVNVTAGRDYVTVSGTFLARDLDAGLELMADVVTHPLFPPDEAEQVRTRTVSGLLQLQQNPTAVADEQLWSQAFGDHPYGAPLLGTLESLPHMSAEEIRAFYREHYRPDRSVLAIAGDVTQGQALASAREWFGSWSGRSAPSPPAPPPAARAPGILLVDRPELARAEIRMGSPSAPRDAPDYLALALANHCLGGASWSWLAHPGAGRAVAEDVRTSLTPLRGTGLFMLSANAAPESTAAAVVRLREAIARFLATGAAEDDVARARRYFQNVFPLQLETLAARSSQWLAADFYGLPADFFDRYDARISAVSVDQAAAAARHWIDPARLTVVVVGPAARIKPMLDRLGHVDLVAAPTPLSATPGAPQEGRPSAEQERRGREIFDQALAAHGGSARLKGIQDSSVEGDLVLTQGGNQVKGTLRQVRKEPYKMVFTTRFESFESRQTLNGRSAWSQAGAESSEVVAADTTQVAGLRSGFDADPVHLLLAASRPGAHAAFEGQSRALDRPVDVVRLDVPGLPRRRYTFDAESHRMLALEEAAPSGVRGNSRRIFSDFKTVDGVLWPMSEERQVAGTRIMLLTLRSVVLDQGVSDALFERPASLDKPFIRMK